MDPNVVRLSGVTVDITDVGDLNRVEAMPGAQCGRESAAMAQQTTGPILLVEDEPLISMMLADMLSENKA